MPRAPVVVTLNGRLWGRRWHAVLPVVRADREVARAALTDLDDDALRDAAAPLAEVVDDRHAFYAWWGGTGGYRIDGEEVGIADGACGCDYGGVVGGDLQGIPSPPAVVDSPAVLEAQLRAAIGRCALTGASGTLHVELTGEDEIVDVAAQLWGGRGDRAATVHCIEEAVWVTQVHVRGAARHSSLTLRL